LQYYTYAEAAYCYEPSRVACLSVSQSQSRALPQQLGVNF